VIALNNWYYNYIIGYLAVIQGSPYQTIKLIKLIELIFKPAQYLWKTAKDAQFRNLFCDILKYWNEDKSLDKQQIHFFGEDNQ